MSYSRMRISKPIWLMWDRALVFTKNISERIQGFSIWAAAWVLAQYRFPPLATTGIDNDLKVVEVARANAEKFGKDIQIIHGNIFDIDKMFEPDSFDACMSGGLLEHFSETRIRELVRKQLVVAPKLIASMPIASYPGEKWDDGIYRNLWDEKYWLDEILTEFKVVHHSTAKASEAIGGFLELEIVIERTEWLYD